MPRDALGIAVLVMAHAVTHGLGFPIRSGENGPGALTTGVVVNRIGADKDAIGLPDRDGVILGNLGSLGSLGSLRYKHIDTGAVVSQNTSANQRTSGEEQT